MGLDPERRIDELFREQMRSGGFTHAFAAAGRLGDPEPAFLLEVGAAGVCFDLASLTKALYTTPAVFSRLKGLGHELKEVPALPLATLCPRLPAFYPDLPGKLNLGRLLSHTSGLTDWLMLWAGCPGTPWDDLSPVETALRRIDLSAKSSLNPGCHCYSDLGFMLPGLLPGFSRWWDPGPGLWFSINRPRGQQVAPTGYCPIRKRVLCGEVHDENAWFLGGACGHAGLFGSGRAVVEALRSLWGTSFGQEVMSLQAGFRRPGAGMSGLRGWQQGDGESSRVFGRGMAIGHLGFTGTGFWLVPETGHYGVLLTNRIVSGRLSPWITGFRKACFSAMDQILR